MCLISNALKRISVMLFLSAWTLGLAKPGAAQTFAQLFAQPKVVGTGNWPAAVYAADVNGDGYPDLLYLDQGATPAASTTHVLLNDGKGNFSPSAIVATAGDSIAIGDLTGQGHVDLGWLTVTNAATTGQVMTTLTVAPGRGDGTFSTKVAQSFISSSAVPYEFHFLQAARLHPAGPLDVVAGDTKTGIVLDLYANAGAGTPSVQLLKPPDGVGPMTVVDLNGDGANDLVVNSVTAHTAQVILGFYAGGFPNGGVDHPPPGFQRVTGISGVYSLVIKDVNLDGRLDLIAEGANGHIDVFFGNGDGTFQSTSSGGTGSLDGTTGNGGHLITVADLNHDGLPDALASTPAGISALLGNGTAYLGLKGIYNAGPGHTSYATADFDGDGNLDLAVDSPEGVAILFGNADGSLQTSQAFASGQPALSGALGAFNQSGTLDAVVSTSATQSQLLRGLGGGSFAYLGSPNAPIPTTSTTGPPGLWSTVQVGDLDSDGNLDILLTADGPTNALPKTPDGLRVQPGDGTGGFGALYPVTTPFGPSCAQSPGLFYGTSALGKNLLGTIVVNRAFDGFRYFLNGNHYPFGGGGAYDFEIDGSRPCGLFAHDIAVTGVFTPRNASTQPVSDFFVQADGHLNLYSAYNDPTFSQPLGDLSVDGSLTISGQRTAPALSATFNGPAIPVASGGLGFPAFIGSAVAADLDRDGNQDLVVAYANLSANLQAPTSAAPNYLYLWFGDGNGRFPVSAAHPVNPVQLTPSRNFYQVAVADLNGDGIPDLILGDGYVLSVQQGKGDGSFGAEMHFLAGQGINSISTGDVDGDGKIDLVLANGGAVLANPVANLEILATNAEVNTGGVTVLLNHASLALPVLAGTVGGGPNPSSLGATFLLNVTFSVAAGQPSPTGSVSFYVGGVLAATGVAGNTSPDITSVLISPSLSTTLGPGLFPVTAVYSGDANYAPVTLTGTHTFVAAAASSLTLTASPEPSTYGTGFTMTATLGAGVSGAGTFNFSVDGTSVGTATSSNGVASIAGPSTLGVGTHALAVMWTGTTATAPLHATDTHTVVIAASSLRLLLCVDGLGSNFPCGTPLTNTPLVSPVTMYFGQVLDGTAIESSLNLTGSVNFLANNTVFCTISANLQGGANACPPTAGDFPAGLFTVQASYSGDANNAPSQSNTIQVRVFPDLTMASVAASVRTAVVGTPVTFTAKVAGNFAVPGGPVQFLDGTTLIGTGTLDATGAASFTTSLLAVGTHVVSVAYAGNANFQPAASAGVTVVITAAGPAPPEGPLSFTLSVTPTPMTLGVGRTGILQVTVTAVNGFAQPVALTCSGLPYETGCTFVNATIAPGGGTTTLQFTTAAPHDCGDPSHPYFLGENHGPGATRTLWAGLVLFAGGLFRIRRFGARRGSRRAWMTMLLAGTLMGLSMMSGCGNCTDLGTKPGSYSFTVTASAQGGPVSESASQVVAVTMTIP